MIDAAQTATEKPAKPQQPIGVSKVLVPFTLLSGILVVAPLFALGKITLAFSALALIVFLPYVVVCWRLLRMPGGKGRSRAGLRNRIHFHMAVLSDLRSQF